MDFLPRFALWVWRPVVCCPLVAAHCPQAGAISSWQWSWGSTDSLGAQHMGVRVHALVLPGGGWHQEPRVCVRVSAQACWSWGGHAVHGGGAVSRGEPDTDPGTGEHSLCGVSHLRSLCSQEHPLTQTLVSPPRILTSCSRSCGLPLLRMQALASCSAASVARAEPRPPWWWPCSPSGTSEYVRHLV